MEPLSKDAKIYLRTLLEYASWFDGFQAALEETLPESNDETCDRQNAASAEIWKLIGEAE